MPCYFNTQMQGQNFTSSLDSSPTESNLNLVAEMNSWEKSVCNSMFVSSLVINIQSIQFQMRLFNMLFSPFYLP